MREIIIIGLKFVVTYLEAAAASKKNYFIMLLSLLLLVDALNYYYYLGLSVRCVVIEAAAEASWSLSFLWYVRGFARSFLYVRTGCFRMPFSVLLAYFFHSPKDCLTN